jgi:hypothetical protein
MNNIPMDIIIEISNYLDNKSFLNLIITNKFFYRNKNIIKKKKQREKKYNDYLNERLSIWEFLECIQNI